MERGDVPAPARAGGGPCRRSSGPLSSPAPSGASALVAMKPYAAGCCFRADDQRRAHRRYPTCRAASSRGTLGISPLAGAVPGVRARPSRESAWRFPAAAVPARCGQRWRTAGQRPSSGLSAAFDANCAVEAAPALRVLRHCLPCPQGIRDRQPDAPSWTWPSTRAFANVRSAYACSTPGGRMHGVRGVRGAVPFGPGRGADGSGAEVFGGG